MKIAKKDLYIRGANTFRYIFVKYFPHFSHFFHNFYLLNILSYKSYIYNYAFTKAGYFFYVICIVQSLVSLIYFVSVLFITFNNMLFIIFNKFLNSQEDQRSIPPNANQCILVEVVDTFYLLQIHLFFLNCGVVSTVEYIKLHENIEQIYLR